MSILPDNGITILDDTLKPNEIYLIQSIELYFGFKMTNNTGKHLYIRKYTDAKGNLINIEINQ